MCFIYRPNNLMIEGMHLNGCGDVSLADLEPYIMQTQREQVPGMGGSQGAGGMEGWLNMMEGLGC